MLHVIKVAPASGGWRMQNGSGPPLLFESSAQAVWSARKLGETLAEGGAAAEVQVMEKDGRMAGRYLCNPAPADDLGFAT